MLDTRHSMGDAWRSLFSAGVEVEFVLSRLPRKNQRRVQDCLVNRDCVQYVYLQGSASCWPKA